MESQWAPNSSFFAQVLNLLRESKTTNQNNVQQKIHEQIQSFNKIPDYNNYLAYIFTELQHEDHYTRTVSGLLLKNNMKESYPSLRPDVQAYIKNLVVKSLGDPVISIRNTAGSIISTIVTRAGLEPPNGWVGLLQGLIQLLDSPNQNYVDGALSCLYKICEESSIPLEKDPNLNVLIPKFISFFQSPFENLRKYAIASLNHFLLSIPPALMNHINSFLEGIFFLTNDGSAEVRVRVCQTFVMLMEIRDDLLFPRIREVVQYMLGCTQDPDEHVSLEACEFWSIIAEYDFVNDVLREFLPKLIESLLSGMVYSEIDLALFEPEIQDENIPDHPKDIKPRFHRSKFVATPNRRESGEENANHHDDGDNDDQDDDEDDQEDEDYNPEWNLRKCSAAGLDKLSGVCDANFLQILLPLLTQRLNDNVQWQIKESAILAIGAIADGCINGITPHLPQLIPYLIQQLSDQQPFIRSITCWSLSRYSKWVVKQDPEKYFKPLMQGLLTRILDNNKRVQEAACSAFATLEEETRENLVPYLDGILGNLMFAFKKYQAKNLLILYDAIATLADSVGAVLNNPTYISILMPPLIQKWNEIPNNDHNLCPLLECLTSIAIAIGPGFAPFAEHIFFRSLKLVETALIAQQQQQQQIHQNRDIPEKEFVVYALDLVSGLAEGIGSNIQVLVSNSNLFQMLSECMKDLDLDIRQSAFALVGDLSKHSIQQMRPYLPNYIPTLINNINPQYAAVCNNACWALGEIAIKIGSAFEPWVAPLMIALINLTKIQNLNQALADNTAIAIGRISLACPEKVAPEVEVFIDNWCLELKRLKDNAEKDSAFRGLCALIKANHQTVFNHFIPVCDAIASWKNPQSDLHEMFSFILHGVKNSLGAENWQRYFHSQQFPEDIRTNLQQKYQL